MTGASAFFSVRRLAAEHLLDLLENDGVALALVKSSSNRHLLRGAPHLRDHGHETLAGAAADHHRCRAEVREDRVVLQDSVQGEARQVGPAAEVAADGV